MGAPHDVMLKVFSDPRPLCHCHHAEFNAQALEIGGRAVEQEPLDSAADAVVTAKLGDKQQRHQRDQDVRRAEAAALKYERDARNPVFEEFLEEQYRLINGKLVGSLKRVMNHDDACDVAAETWKRACRSIHRFDPSVASFNAWLWQIAANCQKDHGKKNKKRQDHEFSDDISEIWDVVPREGIFHYSPNPETIAVREDLEATMRELGAFLGLDLAQQEMLTILLYRTDDQQPAVSDTERKRHERLRAKIEKLTGLDAVEMEAVRLVRSAGSYQKVLAKGARIDQKRFQLNYRRACEKLLKLLTKEIEGNNLHD
jgi:RNA polymerase sigma factor (sigma-70 family)